MSKEINQKGLWKKLKILQTKPQQNVNPFKIGILTSVQREYNGNVQEQEEFKGLKDMLQSGIGHSNQYQQILPTQIIENGKKSGDSMNGQFSYAQHQQEIMIMSSHMRNKEIYGNDPRFLALLTYTKQLRKYQNHLIEFVQYKSDLIMQFIKTAIRDFQFKISNQSQYNQDYQNRNNENVMKKSLIRIQQDSKQHSNFQIQYLQKQIQRIKDEDLHYKDIATKLQQKVNSLQQENDSLSQTIFDYGQKIALLQVQVQQKNQKNPQQKNTQQKYIQTIKQLQNEIQIISGKYLESKKKMDTILEIQQNIDVKDKQLSMKQFHLAKLSTQLQAKQAQLNSQIGKIKEKNIKLKRSQSNTKNNNNISQVPHTNSIVQYPKRTSRLNQSPKSRQAFKYFQNHVGFKNYAIKSVSPSQKYKGFTKNQFDFATNKSIDKEKIFSSKTGVYPKVADKRLTDVSTKLQKLRYQIRKELNEIK